MEVNKRNRIYFEENKIEINEWISKYIEVDKILKISGIDNNSIKTEIEKMRIAMDNLSEKEDINKNNMKYIIDKMENRLEKFNDIQNIIIPNINKTIENTYEIINTKNNNQLVETLCSVITDKESEKTVSKIRSIIEEERKNNKEIINGIIMKDMEEIKNSSNNIVNEFSNMKEMFLKSTKKGEHSEILFYKNLVKEFPSAQVIDKTKENGCGDFHIIQEGIPKILIEIKNYSNNVPKKEIEKFLNDVETNGCWGILLSISSGIATKSNYRVEKYRDNIVSYIHNSGFDILKIRIAIDIMMTINDNFKEVPTNSFYLTEKEILEIKEENENINNSINDISDMLSKSQAKLRTIKLFPKINSILFSKLIVTTTTTKVFKFPCPYKDCNGGASTKSNYNRHINNVHDGKLPDS